MQAKNDVVLVFAGEKENVPRLPMATLVLGAYILEHGFNPILIDLRKDNPEAFKIDWDNVLCAGVSAMSGPPLLSGIKFSKFVKSKNKNIPVVWGGPHASFFPEQTVKEDYIDFVVRNEGEGPFLGLLRCLQKGKDPDGVKGVTFVKDGSVVSVQGMELVNPEDLPLPAYDLVDMKHYLGGGASNISYETSRGCPYRCTFCYVHFFHQHRWRSKSVDKVISDLKEIVEKYHPREIKFVEDNMFVNKARLMEIVNKIIGSGLKFEWNTNCRADTLSRFTVDEMKLIRKSGCTYLALGVESGSERVLKMVQKDITKDQVMAAIKNCLAAGIMPMISLMVGVPREKRRDICDTLDFYDKMMSVDPKNTEINAISIYSPYPGTPMFHEACSLGYVPFDNLEEWAVWQVDDPRYVPWYSKKYRKELDLISSLSRFRYFVHRLEFYPKEYKKAKLGSLLNRALYAVFVPIFSLDASLRWKLRAFGMAPEWKLFDLARARVIKAK